jgi:hypothetical protein
LVIRYFKPYKDSKQIIKEMRKRKTGVFRNDEEISIAVDLLKKIIASKKKEKIYNIARTIEKCDGEI